MSVECVNGSFPYRTVNSDTDVGSGHQCVSVLRIRKQCLLSNRGARKNKKCKNSARHGVQHISEIRVMLSRKEVEDTHNLKDVRLIYTPEEYWE